MDLNRTPLPDPAIFRGDDNIDNIEELSELLEELVMRYDHFGREMEEIVDLEVNMIDTQIEIDNYERRRQELLAELEELQNFDPSGIVEEDSIEEAEENVVGNEHGDDDAGEQGDDEKEDSDEDFAY